MGIEVALLVGAAAASLYWGLFFVLDRRSRSQRVSRLLRGVPARSISELQNGALVKVVGNARPVSGHVEAPLTGKPCVYSRTTIDGSSTVRRTEDARSGAEIWVEDATGRALVQMVEPQPLAVLYPRISGARTGPPTPRERALLQEHGNVRLSLEPHIVSYEFREGYVEVDDEIVVAGVCRMEADPKPDRSQVQSYRDAPTRARIVAPPGGQVLLSDLPTHILAARKGSVK